MSETVNPLIFTDDNEENDTGFMDFSPKYGEDADPKDSSAPASANDSPVEKTPSQSGESITDHSDSITGKPSLSPLTPSLSEK